MPRHVFQDALKTLESRTALVRTSEAGRKFSERDDFPAAANGFTGENCRQKGGPSLHFGRVLGGEGSLNTRAVMEPRVWHSASLVTFLIPGLDKRPQFPTRSLSPLPGK